MTMMIVLTAGIAVSAGVFHGTPLLWVADIAGHVLTPLTERLGYGRALAGTLMSGGDLLMENLQLRAELDRAQATIARGDELEQENTFLRAAAHLRERVTAPAVQAGIFAYLRDGGVRQAIINVGGRDGVARADIVISATGALVGVVRDVATDHSIVRMIGDPLLEVTVRVSGTAISGLLRVDAAGGLIMDLVQKNEHVTEGQTIVTSGNDQIPAGILVGTVRSVDPESTALFKVIRISPATINDMAGSVLIIRP